MFTIYFFRCFSSSPSVFLFFVFVFYVPKRMLIHCIAYLRRAPIADAFDYLCERLFICGSVSSLRAHTHTHTLAATERHDRRKSHTKIIILFLSHSLDGSRMSEEKSPTSPTRSAHKKLPRYVRQHPLCRRCLFDGMAYASRKFRARTHRGYYLFMLCGNLASAIR